MAVVKTLLSNKGKFTKGYNYSDGDEGTQSLTLNLKADATAGQVASLRDSFNSVMQNNASSVLCTASKVAKSSLISGGTI